MMVAIWFVPFTAKDEEGETGATEAIGATGRACGANFAPEATAGSGVAVAWGVGLGVGVGVVTGVEAGNGGSAKGVPTGRALGISCAASWFAGGVVIESGVLGVLGMLD
jgi:hypothetical protein